MRGKVAVMMQLRFTFNSIFFENQKEYEKPNEWTEKANTSLLELVASICIWFVVRRKITVFRRNSEHNWIVLDFSRL